MHDNNETKQEDATADLEMVDKVNASTSALADTYDEETKVRDVTSSLDTLSRSTATTSELEDIHSEVTGKEVDNTTAGINIGSARLKREIGFRDFCFKLPSKPWGYEEHVVVGQTEFVRAGTFLYKRLPLEIQQRVLELLISPLRSWSPSPQTSILQDSEGSASTQIVQCDQSFIRLSIEENYGQFDRQDYEGYVEHPKCPGFGKPDIPRPEHPSRTETSYHMIIRWSGLSSITANDLYDYTYEHLHRIRNISNVSTKMRDMLGVVLWQNIELSMGMIELSFGQLQEFLESRPRIHNFVKKLVISVHPDEYRDARMTRLNSDDLKSTIVYLAEILYVDSIQVDISGWYSAEDFEEFWSDGEPFAELQPLNLLTTRFPTTVT